MLFRLFLSGALLLWLLPLSAQADYLRQPTNQVTLTVGLNRGYFKDRNFSPLNYRGRGTQLGIGYQRTTAAGHRVSTEIGLGLNQLNRDASEYTTTDRYRIDLSVGYLRRLPNARNELHAYAGGKLRSYVDISLFDGSEAVTFYALHAFELAGAVERNVGNRSTVFAAASLPIFGLLSRPPYTGWDKFIVDNSENIPKIVTRGEWLAIGSFTGLRADFGWRYALSERFSMTARYGVAYYATRQLDPVRMLDSTFSLNTSLNF